jgi:hypothetical protein
MNSGIVNFINTLFATEFATIGVIAATVLVFIQLIYGAFSHGELKLVWQNWRFRVLIASVVLNLVFISYLAALVSVRSDYTYPLPPFCLSPGQLAALSLLGFFISIVFFIIWVKDSLGLLHPNNILNKLAMAINYKSISDYLYYKRRQDSDTNIQKAEDPKINPFVPIFAFISRAIDKYDIAKINDAKIVIVDSTECFVQDNKMGIEKRMPHRDYDKQLIEELLIELGKQWDTLFNHSASKSFETACEIILDMTEEILIALLNKSELNEENSRRIFQFWKGIALRSLGQNSDLYKQVIYNYLHIADAIYNNSGECNRAIYEIFRNLGVIGEKILDKPLENKTQMYDSEHQSEFDILKDRISSIVSLHIRKRPNWPSIGLLGLIAVINEKLIIIYDSSNSKEEIQAYILEFNNMYNRLFNGLIEKGNGNAISVFYEIEKEVRLLEKTQNVRSLEHSIKTIVLICSHVAIFKDLKVPGSEQSIFEEIFNYLKSCSCEKGIISGINEVNAEYGRSTDKRLWEFIKDLGKARDTSWGYSFD